MDEWVLDATRAALERMIEHARLVDLPNTDEFTFRAFFMAALRASQAAAQLQTEWHSYDLLT